MKKFHTRDIDQKLDVIRKVAEETERENSRIDRFRNALRDFVEEHSIIFLGLFLGTMLFTINVLLYYSYVWMMQ